MDKKKLYDELYAKAKGIMEKYNPCDFKDGLCARERQNKKEGLNIEPFCCCNGNSFPEQNNKEGTHCKHFVKGSGCSVKSLSCMTWFCGEVPVKGGFYKEMHEIEKKAYENNLYFPRMSKREVFKELTK